ncbi:carbohydrate ABC transporter permease [Microlunatus elymi]|uniref:Carbohydrate ABC transporter permease n=1 Tax=Microlunatus elymi TaxID=2596828 RepID=A0A516PXT2_9ACTN|nr:carbohydrate ABC transporter permease [Microlunatus elymi]QDP95976.1 carbohydrate ABC transporter permease [Microlunatus elymi]
MTASTLSAISTAADQDQLGAAAGAGGRRSRKWVRHLPVHVVMAALGLVWVYPLLWALTSSFKTKMDMFGDGPSVLIRSMPQFQNYLDAWTQANFGRYFFNSVVITVLTVVFTVVFTAMAGYALARTHFPGRKVIMVVVAITMFLPRGYTLIPVFDLVYQLYLLNTIWAVVVVQVAGGMIFSTFLFMGYFMSANKELEEAARVDGAGFNRTFLYVMLPTARPMIATVGLFSFISSWNDFIIPLVFTLGRPDLRTIPVGVAALTGGSAGTDWPVLCAASVMALLPIVIVFVVAQRHIIDAFAGAVKG